MADCFLGFYFKECKVTVNAQKCYFQEQLIISTQLKSLQVLAVLYEEKLYITQT